MSDVVLAERIDAIRWRCPFCHKSWSKQRTAYEHIKRCWLNPAIRSCSTCKHNLGFGPWSECDLGIVKPVDDRDVPKPAVDCPSWAPEPAP